MHVYSVVLMLLFLCVYWFLYFCTFVVLLISLCKQLYNDKKVLRFSIKATVCTLDGYLCLAMCCQKWLERVNTRCGLRFRNPVEHWPLLSLWHPGPSPLVMRLLFAHSRVFHGHFLCKIACCACPQIKALAHEDRRACVYFTGQFKQLLEQNVVKKKKT